MDESAGLGVELHDGDGDGDDNMVCRERVLSFVKLFGFCEK